MEYECEWCGLPFTRNCNKGRVPKYCRPTCRYQRWSKRPKEPLFDEEAEAQMVEEWAVNREQRRHQQQEAEGPMSVVPGRKAVKSLTPPELFEELVNDLCTNRVTPLRRQIPAVNKMAKAWSKTHDEVFFMMFGAMKARVGHTIVPGMPVGYRPGDESPLDAQEA